MSGSHSLDLVAEAIEASRHACEGKRIPVLAAPGDGPVQSRSHRVTQALNRLAHVVGLHVSRVSSMQRTAETTGEALETAMAAYRFLWYDAAGRGIGMATLWSVLQDAQGFDAVYSELADESSKRVFDRFGRFRIAYALVGEVARDLFPADESCTSYAARCAALMAAPGGGFVVGNWVINSDIGVIVDSMVLEQYRLPGVVDPGLGWIALDVGAYKGETAVWLAGRAGPNGAVYALEPDPSTVSKLSANVERNRSATQAPISILPCAVGVTSGKQCFSAVTGGGSHMDRAGEITIDMMTIDQVVEDLGLARVDLIKMDIEGGEVDALRGAEGTLRRLALRLAVCVYHRPHDLPDIAALIRHARPDYSLYLSHHSPNWNETVLFACVSPTCGSGCW